jgi:hypothetical protein
MGDTGADVKLSQKARQTFPYSVECKSHARYAIYQNYEQAVSNADSLTPILVIKQNNSDPLVVLSLEDFMCMLSSE